MKDYLIQLIKRFGQFVARVMDVTLVVTACGFPLAVAVGLTLPEWAWDLMLGGMLTLGIVFVLMARGDIPACYRRTFPKLVSLLSLLNYWTLSIGVATLLRKGTAGHISRNLGQLMTGADMQLGIEIYSVALVLFVACAAWFRKRLVAYAAAFRTQSRLHLFQQANALGREGADETLPLCGRAEQVMRSYYLSCSVAAKSLSSSIYLFSGVGLAAMLLLFTHRADAYLPYFPSVIGLSVGLLLAATLLLFATAVPAQRLHRDLGN
jgi:hypothetical protein